MGRTDANGKPLILGGSLPVENVQALADASRRNLSKIPERYIRPEIKGEPVRRNFDGEEIPVIDLSKLLDAQHSEEEEAKLDFACESWGFFQIINHGIAAEVIDKMKIDIEEFFKLPLEEKKAFAQLPNTIEGYGQAFVLSEDQKLDWGDMFYLFTWPVAYRNLKLWPTQIPTFRDTLDKYSMELRRVTRCLVRVMSKNLGLAPERLPDMFSEIVQSLRMNYYPPCLHADSVLGISPHSDAVGLTLLLQVNQVQGLEIKKNGEWIPIKPIHGALVVNIGDILEIMSNGKYKSIEHRAIINTEKERMSVAAFHNQNIEFEVGPLPELVLGGREKYKTMSQESYFKLVVSSKLQGKSTLEYMKLSS